MTLDFVTKYINRKIDEDENLIKYTFYELRVKNNLSEEDTDRFLELNKTYLENKGYQVFFTGAKYKYKNEQKMVQQNELMIAIKEEKV